MKTIEERIVEFKMQEYGETEEDAKRQSAYLVERGHAMDYAKRFGLLSVAERLRLEDEEDARDLNGGYWTGHPK